VANYGTYGGATFDRAAVVPSRTDTILVTSTEYNDAGQAYKTIDPAGREDRQVFDDAGRVVKAIQNYVDGNPATGGADEDVTVEMAYNADGQLSTLTDSGVATSTLRRAEIYPDSDDTSALGDGADSTYDRIEFKYDRQQRVIEVKDQQETVHAFAFDALGRQTQDRVTALGSGVDGAVRRIATEYDVLGRKAKITSYDNPTVGSGSIVNDLAFVYDNFGQLVTEYQEHGGAVNTGTSLKVQYAYADGSSNTIRLTKMTYPDGRELNYDYGSAGSTDDALSRVASLIDDDGTTHLVDYSYLGRNTFVQTDYPEPDLRYDLAMGAGDDPYDGFDRFGRVVDSRWYDYGSSADVDRILYGYDRASNRTYREQTCDSNSYHDEVYGYDGVNRLTDFDRGTINGNKDAISTLKFAQEWSLDPTGNWSGFKEDDDGDSSWDLDQSRTSNVVNEITDIAETSGPAWATPAYNRAGNMTAIPKPADPTSSFDATYDAWNRLVKLEEGEDTVSEYAYDATKRRVVQKTYDSGELDETRHFYYTSRWQTIEERLESSGTISANADRQFVWGLRYIDELVLRDRDTDANGSLDERLFALQDANWNVTALADTSGDVQERYAYSAYGTPRVLMPTFTTRGSSSYDAEVLYAGYRCEQATAVYHIRHRVYHSDLGCWVQRDPATYVDGVNHGLYRFVADSPIAFVDPFGQKLYGVDGTSETPQDRTNVWYVMQKHMGENAGWRGPQDIISGADSPEITRAVWTTVCVDYCNRARRGEKHQIDMVGWSRGAVIVATVAKLLNDVGCCCGVKTFWQQCGNGFVPYVQCCDLHRPVPVNFVGLFDAVSRMDPFRVHAIFCSPIRPPFVDWARSLTPNIRWAAHLIKTKHVGDRQLLFPTEFGLQPIVEIYRNDGGLTTHSDVGANRENNTAYLQMMWFGRNAGVPFNI